jgi:hypothetical protein
MLTYFDTRTQLMDAIGAVLGLVDAVKSKKNRMVVGRDTLFQNTNEAF